MYERDLFQQLNQHISSNKPQLELHVEGPEYNVLAKALSLMPIWAQHMRKVALRGVNAIAPQLPQVLTAKIHN